MDLTDADREVTVAGRAAGDADRNVETGDLVRCGPFITMSYTQESTHRQSYD
jgi:hypothetical protein